LHAIENAFAKDRLWREEDAALFSIRTLAQTLTPREREVMGMVTAGLLNKQIAGELKLSEVTVKMHRRNLMEKMQAGSLAELVRMCERARIPSRSS
jgi:FixJ family two-component response regulator